MMAETYSAVVTNLGTSLIEDAYNNSSIVNITQMAIGDSNGVYVEPNPVFTSLVNELGREDIHESSTVGHLIHVYVYVTSKFAGNTIREFGLYDDANNLVVYAAYPESLVPDAASGEYIQLEIECIVDFENAEVVNIVVNPIYPHATELEAGIAKIVSEADVDNDEEDSKLLTIKKLLKRAATTLKAGVARFSTSAEAINGTDVTTMLNPSAGLALLKSRISSALDGTRTDYSASESALGQVNTKAENAQNTADEKWTAQDASTSQKGIVQLSDVVTSTSTVLAATANAVKTAYDKAVAALNAATAAQSTANGKWTAQDATTAVKGITMLSNATDGTSQSKAATEYALGLVNEKIKDATDATPILVTILSPEVITSMGSYTFPDGITWYDIVELGVTWTGTTGTTIQTNVYGTHIWNGVSLNSSTTDFAGYLPVSSTGLNFGTVAKTSGNGFTLSTTSTAGKVQGMYAYITAEAAARLATRNVHIDKAGNVRNAKKIVQRAKNITTVKEQAEIEAKETMNWNDHIFMEIIHQRSLLDAIQEEPDSASKSRMIIKHEEEIRLLESKYKVEPDPNSLTK
ncbi:tail fiber protein [Vibrio parahaemolyticus]|uniref:tail fiber protein n=2 Tax=Vibrio parahaemolyticus TaxID=670 RepID=UPI00041FDC1B|nr:tail fiber protein [Vibrio parahaemolyticus]